VRQVGRATVRCKTNRRDSKRRYQPSAKSIAAGAVFNSLRGMRKRDSGGTKSRIQRCSPVRFLSGRA